MRPSHLALAVFFVVLMFPTPAHAYLDPGSGSYFLQVALGVALGGLVSMKIYWKKVKSYKKRLGFHSARNAKKRKN
jgi:hypothetical protein